MRYAAPHSREVRHHEKLGCQQQTNGGQWVESGRRRRGRTGEKRDGWMGVWVKEGGGAEGGGGGLL